MQMRGAFAERGINLNINIAGSFSPGAFTGTGVERIDYIQNDLKVTTSRPAFVPSDVLRALADIASGDKSAGSDARV